MPTIEVYITPAELQSETWGQVSGYEGHYEISNMGRVKSLKDYHGFKPGRLLRPKLGKDGYLTVELCLNSKTKTHRVAHLVAERFVGERPSRLHECNHKDTNKQNNRHWNLEWLTKAEHAQHSVAHGLYATGDRHGLRKHPGAAASGDRHGSKTHPERFARGDAHWTRRVPNAQSGENNNASKLSNQQRDAIRAEYAESGISMKNLGKKHNVSAQTICNIVKSDVNSET